MHRGNSSVPIDDERGRQRFEAAILIAGFIVAQNDAVVDFFPGYEGVNRFPAIVIHRHAEHFEAAIFVLALELGKPGDFGIAGSAPGGPEIEQHDFTVEIGEMDQLAVRVFQSKIGRMFSLAVFLDGAAHRPFG